MPSKESINQLEEIPQESEDLQESASNEEKELSPEKKEAIQIQKIRDDRDAAIKKAMDDAKEAEKEYQATIFKKFGWKLKTDMRYDGALLKAGSRHKLGKLSNEEKSRLEEKEDISK